MGALFFCNFLYAQDWKDLGWLKVVHYDRDFFGFDSEADNSAFFLHPEGKTRPDLELETLKRSLLVNEVDESKNVFCRFPARIRYLRSIGYKVPEQKIECTKLNTFRKRLAGESLSVVFSSYYLNNPGSSFGHTFLRIGKDSLETKAKNDSHTELLDTGVNYGALTEGANPVLYALGGLAGFFFGNYNAIPYYYKVREYNDFETRDLWSYELDFTKSEIDFIVDHIWEMGHTRFRYFFLTENCSYHVLTILEASRPKLNLRQHMPSLYTIPSETLKALSKEHLVKTVSFRPAASTLFYHQLEQLSAKDQTQVLDLFDRNISPHSRSPEKTALIYDAALALFDFKYAKDILKEQNSAHEKKRPLLVGRSRIPVRSPNPDFSQQLKDAPHDGHGQKRLAVSGINIENKNFFEAEWRFAFHDFLDRPTGFPPTTKIDIMKFTLLSDGNSHHLREALIMDVFSVGNWDKFNQSPSFKIKIGQWETRKKNMFLVSQGVSGGYGYGMKLSRFNPYILLHAEGAYVQEFQKMKLAYGSDQGFLLDLGSSFKHQSALEWRVLPWDETRWINEIRFNPNDLGVGAFYHHYLRSGVTDMGIRSFFYF